MKHLIQFFTSLKLTVVLLFLSIVLVFFGTLDQVHLGIRAAQEKYFQSFIAFWQYPTQWPLGEQLDFIYLPIAGGYLLGGLLLINLISSHIYRFKPTWRKSGIFLIHGGLILLLVSELLTGLLSRESRMWITEGGSSNYSESFHKNEFAIVDTSDPDQDTVVSIPTELLEAGEVIEHPELPFSINPLAFYPNSAFPRTADAPDLPPSPVDRGLGVELDVAVRERPVTYAEDEVNLVTSVVELTGNEGEELGTWLVSNVFSGQFEPQEIEVNGRSFEIELRFKRYYKDFWLDLHEFRFDRYPGTEIARNFSSLVRIDDPVAGEDRQVLIYMNHPLRYGGLTFYQASFLEDETATMLQVVRNPGWILPYFACTFIGLGLIVQFSIHFFGFLRKKQK